MDAVIESKSLTVSISAMGAEMQSITDKDGTEYLWNGEAGYWTGRAPNLFPYIGRLTNGAYTLFGRQYRMGIHGFAAGKEFALEQSAKDTAVFVLRDDDETRKMYPFEFTFRVSYRLAGGKIGITYAVENNGGGAMYFAVGGHPGFRLPFERGLAFEDYCLEFPIACAPQLMELSESCFVTGKSRPYPLVDGRVLRLSHDLFDNDALILDCAAKSVTLKSGKGEKGVKVTYPGMRYLGLWHMPKTKAPYICIEPWTSLPSREGVTEELSEQQDMITLAAGERYSNEWGIEITGGTGNK